MPAQLAFHDYIHEHGTTLMPREERGVVLHPSLYQINTPVLMQELATTLGRPATLDDVPDEDLDYLAQLNFDWVWFLGVWQTGAASQKVSRENQQWRAEFREFLPD